MVRWLGAPIIVCAIVAVFLLWNGEPRLGRFPASQFFIEHDRFLPATDPGVLGASAAAFLRPTDEVFGVVVAGQARAYPITMIAYHHVVNDTIRGTPIAVTY
jgi:hypothetical protein